MNGAGTRARERFFRAMQAVDVGARLTRRSVVWTVTACVHRATSVELTLRSGRHAINVSVMVCGSGPVLWEAGLRPVADAPSQHELPGMAACADQQEFAHG
jgi:hypothetical protein